jgi:hypothetical protein
MFSEWLMNGYRGQSRLVRDYAGQSLARDAALAYMDAPAGNLGPVNEKLQNLRSVITNAPDDWIQSLRQAYAANPSAFPAVLLPLILGASGYEGSQR